MTWGRHRSGLQLQRDYENRDANPTSGVWLSSQALLGYDFTDDVLETQQCDLSKVGQQDRSNVLLNRNI
jgi:hypothetical protein